jgi:hypothetical protein
MQSPAGLAHVAVRRHEGPHERRHRHLAADAYGPHGDLAGRRHLRAVGAVQVEERLPLGHRRADGRAQHDAGGVIHRITLAFAARPEPHGCPADAFGVDGRDDTTGAGLERVHERRGGQPRRIVDDGHVAALRRHHVA